jgi:phage terminase Nu1 subunit (DNA packaging protein)
VWLQCGDGEVGRKGMEFRNQGLLDENTTLCRENQEFLDERTATNWGAQGLIDENVQLRWTVADLAEILQLTERRIQKLAENGELECIQGRDGRYYFEKNVVIRKYIDGFRNKIADLEKSVKHGKTLDKNTIPLDNQKDIEDVRLKKARADIAEMQSAEIRGDLHRADDIENIFGNLLTRLVAEIKSLPGRLGTSTAFATTPAETTQIINSEVISLINNFSEFKYNKNDFIKLARERTKKFKDLTE